MTRDTDPFCFGEPTCDTRDDLPLGQWCSACLKRHLGNVSDALSWALDLIDMYDEHLAEHDGEEAVYTATHLAGKAKARAALNAVIPDMGAASSKHDDQEPSDG